jgi:hypothetical protein
METFYGPQSSRKLEVRGNEVFFSTGNTELDEVREIYASASDATLAADFIRDAWRAEGYSLEPWHPPSLILGLTPAPKPRAGSLLLGASGEALRRERPKPVKRISLADAVAKDKKLATLVSRRELEYPRWEGTALVGATVAAGGRSKSPLKNLLKSRAGQSTLKRLTVSVEEEGDLEQAVELLEQGLPENVETLTLASYRAVEHYCETRANLSAVLPACKSVKRLTLQAGQLELDTPELPGLVELRVRAAGLPGKTVRNVLAAEWPNLESLTFFFGSQRQGCDASLTDLGPLLSGAQLPKLHTLRLQASEWGAQLADALATAAVLPRLRVIDLSCSLLTAEAVERLASAMPSTARLIVLDTSLRREEREALKQRYPHVRAENPALGSTPVESVEHFLTPDDDEPDGTEA